MKYIITIALLVSAHFCFSQTIYPWGSNTGRSQAKGLLQSDSGIKFIPKTLGPFRYTGDSICVLQVSAIDSLLYFTKNGINYNKIITNADSNNYVINGGQGKLIITIGSLLNSGFTKVVGYTTVSGVTQKTGIWSFDKNGQILDSTRGAISLTGFPTKATGTGTGKDNMVNGDNILQTQYKPLINGSYVDQSGNVNQYSGDGTTMNNFWVWFLGKSGGSAYRNVPKFHMTSYFNASSSPMVISGDNGSADYDYRTPLGYDVTNPKPPAWLTIFFKGQTNTEGSNTTNLPGIMLRKTTAFTQTGDYIVGMRDTTNKDFYIDINGSSHVKTLSTTGIRNVSSNTTLLDTDGTLRVNTSGGNITVTLSPSANYSMGRWFTVLKATPDANSVTIQTTGGELIQGNTSYLIDNAYGSCTFQVNAGEFISGHNPDTISSSAIPHLVAAGQFGMKADGRRIPWVSATASSKTITAPSGTFSAADVGKGICIHKVRAYAAYTTDSESIVCKIASYINSGSVTIDSTPDFSYIDSISYFGSINDDKFAYGVAYCKNNNISTIYLDQTGLDYLMFPTLSDTAKAQAGGAGSTRGTRLSNVTVQGSGYKTSIKWCVEDDDHIDSLQRFFWNAFVHFATGEVILKDFTMKAPDRYTHDKGKFSGVAVWASGNLTGSIKMENVNIIGDSIAKKFNPDYAIQWGYGLSNSVNATGGYYNMELHNVNIFADFQGITYFGDPGTQCYLNYHNDLPGGVYYTGSHLESKPYLASVNVNSGSDTVTYVGSKDFSWYYCTSVDVCNLRYKIRITDGVHTWNTVMKTIISPHVCVMTTTSPNSYTNADLYPTNSQNLSMGEGHAFYIHHNISTFLHNVNTYGCNVLNMQLYSATGVDGEAAYHIYEKCNHYSYGGYGVGVGALMSHQDSSTVLLKDCDSFLMYSLGQPIKYTAINTGFIQAYAYNRDTFLNCWGNISVQPGGIATIQGGVYNSIILANGGPDSCYIRSAKVATISQANATNGYMQVSNTDIGAITGAGTVTRQNNLGNGIIERWGNGSPEGVVTGAVSSTYNRMDGSPGTLKYIKTSGTGNTGWTAVY